MSPPGAKISKKPTPHPPRSAARQSFHTGVCWIIQAVPRRPLKRDVDDLPVAQRAYNVLRPPQPLWRRLLWPACGALLALLVSLGLWRSGHLVRQVTVEVERPPTALESLYAKVDDDRRLLGHFPYPLATPEELVELRPGLLLHRDAAEAFGRMRIAARRDGVGIYPLSGFRDLSLQEALFFDLMAERNQDPDERSRVSAPPGYSEHHSGYAVDIGDTDRPSLDLSESFEQSPAFGWLARNAARFHFYLSFPRGNKQGVTYEPWHWRFEGTSAALTAFATARETLREH
ncbi:MAG: D-alanyl-D-alanine carboxypeptidase family protein [Aphanocapsa feldmannii 277cV]|uniref:D-alanyl-D-alanine carboxypeptidase family protein n=1 Tax=Aphanocapsa feldmannii 277cV TaxID=2507553 RepID=A0A524RL99_9CHRO|nr:MAG: D-alanyl-D-alanine carboxypeptidase family protein [Aphanocapsa feldmannii 277cV]